MTGPAFMRYMRARVKAEHPATCVGDPYVEFYDGVVRLTDGRGSGVDLTRFPTRALRALATQLQLVADEVERRACEDGYE